MKLQQANDATAVDPITARSTTRLPRRQNKTGHGTMYPFTNGSGFVLAWRR